MPAHFSYNKVKMRKDVLATDQEGNDKEFFGSAFLQYRTEWDEDAGRFKPMTDEQKEVVRELWDACHDAGVEISVGLFERVEGQPAKDWPRILGFSLRVNDPER